MKGQLRFLFIMMVVGTLFSCQRITRYHHYQPVGSDGWGRTDTLTFRLPCVSGSHLLSVGLRHGPRFPYQELSVEAQTTIAPQGIVRRDTLRLRLATPQGEPLSTGVGLGQRQQPLLVLQLDSSQQATVRLRHIMHREVVPDVRDVGILLERQ